MKLIFLFLSLAISAVAFDHNEAVAAVIIGEAGGEGNVGMQAVASVIQNRMVRKTAFEIVSARYQFSAVNAVIVSRRVTWEEVIVKAKRHKRWAYALELSKRLNSKAVIDITHGSTQYYAYSSPAPYWVKSFRYQKTIGGHKFYSK